MAARRTAALAGLAALVLTALGAAAPARAEAQAGTAASGELAALDRAAEAQAGELADLLRTAGRGSPLRVEIGDFALNGELPPLSLLWAHNLAAALAEKGRGSFAVAAGPSAAPSAAGRADYRIMGEILDLGSTLRIQTQLLRLADGVLAAGLRRDFPAASVPEELLAAASGGARRDRQEPDSRSDPVSIAADGTWIDRTIHDGDEDWFAFTLPIDGIAVMETEGGLDTVVEAFSADGGASLGEDDDSGDDENARLSVYGRQGDTILAKVTGFETETGAYRFSVRAEPMENDGEPNDVMEDAGALALGESVTALFGSSEDTDWYRFEVPEPGAFMRVRTTGDLDTELRLYDGRGRLLAEDDDSGDGGNAALSRFLGAGSYYLEVKEYDGAAGLYGLEVRPLPVGAADAYENDDEQGRAKPITLGGRQDRTFSHAADEDWVRFAAVRSGRYVFTAAAAGGVDTYLELYDEAGELLDENDDDGGDLDAAVSARLGPGIYYLRVTQLDEELDVDDAGYTLSVESRP